MINKLIEKIIDSRGFKKNKLSSLMDVPYRTFRDKLENDRFTAQELMDFLIITSTDFDKFKQAYICEKMAELLLRLQESQDENEKISLKAQLDIWAELVPSSANEGNSVSKIAIKLTPKQKDIYSMLKKMYQEKGVAITPTELGVAYGYTPIQASARINNVLNALIKYEYIERTSSGSYMPKQ